MRLSKNHRINAVLYQLLEMHDNLNQNGEDAPIYVTANELSKTHLVSRRYMARILNQLTREGLLTKTNDVHWNGEKKCLYTLSDLGFKHGDYIRTINRHSVDMFIAWKQSQVNVWSELK